MRIRIMPRSYEHVVVGGDAEKDCAAEGCDGHGAGGGGAVNEQGDDGGRFGHVECALRLQRLYGLQRPYTQVLTNIKNPGQLS